MWLSEEQLSFFYTFGFLKFPALFAAEAKEIGAEFERVWAESGMEHDHKGAAIHRPLR